jgi:hypothetical protein
MSANKLLIPEPPLQVLPTLAKQIGLNEAIFAQQLHYMLINPNLGETIKGEKWIFNTLDEWREVFPFWSINTIRGTIERLAELGIIKEGNFNKALSRRKWYTLDYLKLENAKKSGRKSREYSEDLNFGYSMKRLKSQRASGETVKTSEYPNFGSSNIQTLDNDSSKSPAETSTKNTDSQSSESKRSESNDPNRSESESIHSNVGGNETESVKSLSNSNAKAILDNVESSPTEPNPHIAAAPFPLLDVAPTIPTGYFARITPSDEYRYQHLVKIGAKKPLCKCVPFRWANPPMEGNKLLPICPACLAAHEKASKPKAERKPRERKPQPTDPVFDALLAGMIGHAPTPADRSAFGWRIGKILFGDRKSDRCEGLLAFESIRTGIDSAALDFNALAVDVALFWANFKKFHPDLELKDCVALMEYWAKFRAAQSKQSAAAVRKTKRHNPACPKCFGTGMIRYYEDRILSPSERVADQTKLSAANCDCEAPHE